jgi:enoyl-CoA hydratase/carnithine racemase
MLRVDDEGSVRRVRLWRPEVRNAFNEELIHGLTVAFQDIGAGTRVVMLSGEGKAFCAGGDLDWMRRAAGCTFDENVADALRLAGLFQAIQRCPAAVIARVHGAVFGGGCGLVAAADVAVAASDTLFAFSEVRLGVIPATISTVVTPKIGAGHARALYTTGETFGADRALQIGLIHESVPPGELDGAVEAKVKSVLSAGPQAVAASKALALDHPLDLEEAARRLAGTRAGAEAREGIDAFLDKRKASFVEVL